MIGGKGVSKRETSLMSASHGAIHQSVDFLLLVWGAATPGANLHRTRGHEMSCMGFVDIHFSVGKLGHHAKHVRTGRLIWKGNAIFAFKDDGLGMGLAFFGIDAVDVVVCQCHTIPNCCVRVNCQLKVYFGDGTGAISGLLGTGGCSEVRGFVDQEEKYLGGLIGGWARYG